MSTTIGKGPREASGKVVKGPYLCTGYVYIYVQSFLFLAQSLSHLFYPRSLPPSLPMNSSYKGSGVIVWNFGEELLPIFLSRKWLAFGKLII